MSIVAVDRPGPAPRCSRSTPISGVENTAVGISVVVDHRRLAAEDRVGEGMALADRDRRQVDPVGDVADGVDRGRRASANSRRPAIGADRVDARRPPSRGRARRCSAAGRSRPAPGRPRRVEPSDRVAAIAAAGLLEARDGPCRERGRCRAAHRPRPSASRTSSSKPRRSLSPRCRSVTSLPRPAKTPANSTAM